MNDNLKRDKNEPAHLTRSRLTTVTVLALLLVHLTSTIFFLFILPGDVIYQRPRLHLHSRVT